MMVRNANVGWVGALWLGLGAGFGCSVEDDVPAEDAVGGGAGVGGASGGSGGDSGSGGASALAGSTGAGASGAAGAACFSPANPRPPGSSFPSSGCACDANKFGPSSGGVCVVSPGGTAESLPSHTLFVCAGGLWVEAADGACAPVSEGGSRCQVKGPKYTQIVWRGDVVTSPFSFCNSCTCSDDGTLVDCTTDECAEQECPSETVRGDRCLGCRFDGGCDIVETGCLPACEDDGDCSGRTPSCVNGVCAAAPCP